MHAHTIHCSTSTDCFCTARTHSVNFCGVVAFLTHSVWLRKVTTPQKFTNKNMWERKQGLKSHTLKIYNIMIPSLTRVFWSIFPRYITGAFRCCTRHLCPKFRFIKEQEETRMKLTCFITDKSSTGITFLEYFPLNAHIKTGHELTNGGHYSRPST